MNEIEKSRLLPVRRENVSGRVMVEMEEERCREAAEVGRRRQPRTVVVAKKKGRRSVEARAAHSQILRIRAEDSRVGEDGICGAHEFIMFSRHILPASPLSGTANAANSLSLTSGA